MNDVSIYKLTTEIRDQSSVDEAVREVLSRLGPLQNPAPKDGVCLLKPNVGTTKEPAIGNNTDVRVTLAVARWIRSQGGTPVVAESSGVGSDTEVAFEKAGYGALRKEGIELVDLKKTPLVRVRPVGTRVLKQVWIYKMALHADYLVNIPKFKTGLAEKASLGLKNLKGLIPDADKRRFHRELGVSEAVADLATIIKPDLTIVDGIVGGQGMGDAYRELVDLRTLVAGTDPLSVDQVCARIMGLQPEEIRCLNYAFEAAAPGHGDQIRILGDSIASCRILFKTAIKASEELPKSPVWKEILDPKVCTGCQTVALFAIKRILEEEGEGFLDHVKVSVGSGVKKVCRDGKVMVSIGNCAPKGHCVHIKGCPPNNPLVIKILKEQALAQ